MNIVQRVFKNTAILLVAQLFSMGLGLFTTMYTARYLGIEGFGILNFALALAAILGVIADLGLSSLSIRDLARNKELTSKYIGTISLIKLALIIPTFGLIVLVSNLMGYPRQTSIVIQFIALSVICSSLSAIFNSVFQAYEKMEYVSLGRIISSVLMFASIIIAINRGFDVIGLSSLYLGASIFVLIYSIFLYKRRKFGTFELVSNWAFFRNLAVASLPFFLASMIDIISFKIDIVMLSSMKGDAVVGLYSAAFRLMEILMFIPTTFIGSIYPVISIFHMSSQKSLSIVYRKSIKYLIAISFPIAAGTTIIANKIIYIIYNYNYANSSLILQILIWNIPSLFLSYLFGIILASTNKQKLVFRISLISIAINVSSNLILIPKYSLIGASYATLITSISTLLLLYYYSSKFIERFTNIKFISKIIISNIIMCIFVYSFININIAELICLSAFVYTMALIILRTFSREDVEIARKLFQKS
jgi:O-antigen/teichoic acid export membrane protein